jgi:aspartate/glutamate racemase
MKKVLVCLHTLPLLIEVFNHLGERLLEGVQLVHILDEPLLARIRQRGRAAAEDSERIESHLRLARQIGASAVLVTCSTLSPLTIGMEGEAALPLIRIDEEMASRAVSRGDRIGVIATSETTLEPTRKMLADQAAAHGKRVEIEMRYIEGALDRLLGGDGGTHDHLVGEAIRELSSEVDVIVLAQASMARVLDTIPDDKRSVEILSSPRMAVEQARRLLLS